MHARGFSRSYFLSMFGAACLGAGLMSFELISYHLVKTGVVKVPWVPVFLAVATGVGVAANLVFGKAFDKWGTPVVVAAIAVSACFPPLVFLGSFFVVLAGLILWGVGNATQDTLLKAVVAGMLPEGRRSLAFGLFYAGYGVGWLIGSSVSGLLYSRSIGALIAFSIAAQGAALMIFAISHAKSKSAGHAGVPSKQARG